MRTWSHKSSNALPQSVWINAFEEYKDPALCGSFLHAQSRVKKSPSPEGVAIMIAVLMRMIIAVFCCILVPQHLKSAINHPWGDQHESDPRVDGGKIKINNPEC